MKRTYIPPTLPPNSRFLANFLCMEWLHMHVYDSYDRGNFPNVKGTVLENSDPYMRFWHSLLNKHFIFFFIFPLLVRMAACYIKYLTLLKWLSLYTCLQISIRLVIVMLIMTSWYFFILIQLISPDYWLWNSQLISLSVWQLISLPRLSSNSEDTLHSLLDQILNSSLESCTL